MSKLIARTYRRVFILATCGLLFSGVAVVAQESGGDLSGGAGIFRSKNPETNSKRRKTGKPPGPRTNRPNAKTAAEIAAEVEDRLDEGNEARDNKKFDDAEKAYKEALRLDNHNWRAAYGLGNVYLDQQRWALAEEAYRQASALNISGADIQIALSYVLVQPRADGSQARRLADAETAARRAISLQPQNAVAYDRLGAAMETRGIFTAETEQAYRKAIELDPNFAVAYVHLAREIRRDPKRAAEAEPLYQKASELAKDAPTLVLIGEALQSEQRYQDSEKPLKAALALDANNPSALYLLGRMNVVLKNYKEAEPLLLKAIEVSPRSFEPYQVLVSDYLKLGRFDDAENILNKASSVAPSSIHKQLAGGFGFTGVGDGYAGAGRTKDAIRAYQAALKFDPQNSDVQRKLSQLNSGPN
jgi:tetratricopeptide (TPR) repeat protein